MRHAERAQATAELGLLVLVLAVLLIGMVGVTEVVQTEMGLTTVAEEAARAAALAPSADLVQDRGQERGLAVGTGYALRNGSLTVSVDPDQFQPGGRVRAVASYRLTSRDVPLLGWGSLALKREHVEVVPRFRSLPG